MSGEQCDAAAGGHCSAVLYYTAVITGPHTAQHGPVEPDQTAFPGEYMNKNAILAYGAAAYTIFFLTFLYMIGFLANVGVTKSIDNGEPFPPGLGVIINLFLIALFAVPHTVMARPEFKKWWTQYVPKTIERSTYVLIGSLLLLFMFWQWRTIYITLWHFETPVFRAVLWAFFLLGWLIVLVSTFLINHFDLFGLRQVWLHYKDKEYTHLPFGTPLLYKIVRHPLYAGFLIAFWVTPDMSLGHFIFAAAMTAYIVIALKYEEHDLESFFGEAYTEYKRKVPKLIPFMKPK